MDMQETKRSWSTTSSSSYPPPPHLVTEQEQTSSSRHLMNQQQGNDFANTTTTVRPPPPPPKASAVFQSPNYHSIAATTAATATAPNIPINTTTFYSSPPTKSPPLVNQLLPPPPPPPAPNQYGMVASSTSYSSLQSPSTSSRQSYGGIQETTTTGYHMTTTTTPYNDSSSVSISSPTPATTVTQASSTSYDNTSYNSEQYQYNSNYYSPKSLPSPSSPTVRSSTNGTSIANPTINAPQVIHHHNNTHNRYQHNHIMCFFLLPIIATILLSHVKSSFVPIQFFLFTCLIIYGFDLCNYRDGLYISIWIFGVIINTMLSGWYWLLSDDTDDDDSGFIVLEIMFKVAVTALVYICTACWLILQFHYEFEHNNSNNNSKNNNSKNNSNKDAFDSNMNLSTWIDIESMLHSIIPPIFATFFCQSITQWIAINQPDIAAIMSPHLFAFALLLAMMIIGSCPSSFYIIDHGNDAVNNPSITGKSSSIAASSSKRRSLYIPIKYYAIQNESIVKGHVWLLLIMPFLIHIFICSSRIFSSYSTIDDWYDMILTICVPYILLYFIQPSSTDDVHKINTKISGIRNHHPYRIERIFPLFNNNNNVRLRICPSLSSATTLYEAMISYIPLSFVISITSFIIHQRYILSFIHYLLYQGMGIINISNGVITCYWMMTTVTFLFLSWVWKRPSMAGYSVVTSAGGGGGGLSSSTTSNEVDKHVTDENHALLFGEYQEDVIQITLAIGGLCLGKAFGLPWNMTPLPILGILGVALWITSRMLRYLAITLFVWHASAVVIFTYRFVGIEQIITLPTYPTISITLLNFGIFLTSASMLIGLTAGLSVRSNGGWMSSCFKKTDMAGQLFIYYMIMLSILEVTLLKLPYAASKELTGIVDIHQLDSEELHDETIYEPILVYITSVLAIGLALFMKRIRIIRNMSLSIVISIAIGKAIAVFIDEDTIEINNGTYVLLQAFITSAACMVIYLPRLLLKPVYLKASTRYKRDLSGMSVLSKSTIQTILLYVLIILPVTLLVTVPYNLFPLINKLAGDETYHYTKTPMSELVGAVIAIWGLSCLSMLNYYLPDGGGEAWKKISALAFFIGAILFFVAPTLGLTAISDVTSNPYASLSSVGSQIIRRSKSRTGGWGLLSATIAILLAMTGPLNLQERHIPGSRQKDTYLLFRTMTFSLMFGGGVAWFITVQLMSDTKWIFLVLTLTSSMIIAFLGTCVAVFGCYLDLQNFDEVEQLVKIWILAFVSLLLLSGIPQFVGYRSVGGWLSSYAAVSSLSAMSIAIAISKRKTKDERTRGVGNVACIGSWLLSILQLYGTFGIVGDNSDLWNVFGLPPSVIGTIIVSPILFLLEGETSSGGSGQRRISITTPPKRNRGSIIVCNLQRLKASNRWLLPFIGTVSIFLLSSLYVVLLRGLLGRSLGNVHLVDRIEPSLSLVEQDILSLAKKVASISGVAPASVKLANSGFWTSATLFGPLLHLFGIIVCFPGLYLLICKWWLETTLTSNQVILCIPLYTIPLFFCRGIPQLPIAALCILIVCSHLWTIRRREERYINMQM